MEITKETWAFIAAHQHEDVRDVALHARRADGVDVPFALEQIAGRQRARVKLPDWAAIDGLIFPPQVPMEQCSSQFTARYKARLAQRLVESLRDGTPHTADVGRPADASGDASAGRPTDHSPAATSLIDLTGGFGVDFSYMAQVFDHVTYVERQPLLCDIARHNLPLLGLTHANVVNGDSTDVLGSLEPASMIFLDPARRDDHGARTYAIADCTPDVLALQEALLAKAPVVMVKLSPMLDWHKTVADFAGAVAEVHIVSTGNECKELLLVLTRAHVDAPRVWCVNDDQVLDFIDTHLASSAGPLPPEQWRYLYEPNASIMKAGCFDVVERRFGVRAVGRNSHLFVADGPVADFPGRSFVIESVATMNKRELKSLTEGLTHVNIAVRNFPMPVAQLRRKLKLKDGGDTYLFATTDAHDRHIVIRTVKAATRYSNML
ncbi:SAM-dependent methyltransferase [Bifidobacterium sp. UTBIF-78]|uniref:THUMP-like domain-containing protein n=1 Tax=Bifidobacterium sp. UTBIF-78 TaxID=1465263 RepID=UPI001128B663|nr:SAM-dependent methyltransferase [Bifidobacterium sp. UTBIF-78]TPF94861.1 DNA methyltransferase [Bifidobacterium sp. UTBIF-78]